MSEYLTTGDIARAIGRPLHAVIHTIGKLGVKERGKRGNCRLYSVRELAEVQKEFTRRSFRETEQRAAFISNAASDVAASLRSEVSRLRDEIIGLSARIAVLESKA